MTGGHYIFLNYNSLSEDTTHRKPEILEAADKIRHSLSGNWGYVVELPTYQDASFVETPGGSIYQLKGYLTLDVPQLSNEQKVETFALGPSEGAKDLKAASADHRLALRKGCVVGGCGGDANNPCAVRCSPETGLCAPPAAGSSCTDSGGLQGVCCSGSCKTDAGPTALCTDSPSDCP